MVCELEELEMIRTPRLSERVHLNKNLGNIPDGTSNFSATSSALTYRPLSNPLTSTDAGSNATVSIAAFTMRTSSKGDISVNSGSITALSYKTLYYIYYDDSTLAGGAVTYNATTTKETAIQGSARFFVGSIVTAVATGPTITGNNDGGVGAQAGQTSVFLFGVATPSVAGGLNPGYCTSPNNAIDGSLTTKASVGTTGPSQSEILTLSGASPSSAPWISLTLKVRSIVNVDASSVPAGGNGYVALSYSLDGGVSYTDIYRITNSTLRSLTTDSIALPVGQNLALVRVRADNLTDGTGTGTNIDLYEAWVLGLQ